MAGTPILDGPPKVKTPRRSARHRVEALVYVGLGSENGGFPINISEDGMAYQGILPLELNQDICIKFKLNGMEESVTTSAKIVWLRESRKGGALQFVDLSDASRRLISDWISLLRKVDGPKEIATPVISEVDVRELLADSAISPATIPSDSSAQSATVIPLPPPDSTLPSGEAAQGLTPMISSVADANAKESLPVQDSQDSVDLRQSSPLPASLAMHEKKRGWTDPYRFGLAASVTIMIVGAVALWPFRANVFHHTLSNDPAHANVDSASSPAVALPAEHVGVVAPSSDAPITESPEPAPVEDVQEYPTMPSPPDGAMSAPSDPAKNTTPVVPKINRRTSSKTPLFPANEIHPRNHATMPAQSEQPPMEPPNSNLEGGNGLPGAGIDGGKIFPLELKTPGNPVTATGSIEIVSDPYPSIRVPSGTQGRKSRPGTSLQIGRLTSKIEPLYPAEELGQRVAGRVRVHVLIGRNGSIERAELVEGPALLTETALRDVQQLHFEPTLLGGMAIEVEEDITVIFHIANSPSAAN